MARRETIVEIADALLKGISENYCDEYISREKQKFWSGLLDMAFVLDSVDDDAACLLSELADAMEEIDGTPTWEGE
jgi:hypothetical protein